MTQFTHIIVFDSKSDNHVQIDNLPDDIELLFNNSPVLANINNEEQVIGYITDVQNRPHTSLYYGNLYISNKYPEYTKIKIKGHNIRCANKNSSSIYHAVNIATFIEKIDADEIKNT